MQLFAAGSFNDHVIHHLLPTVDLSKQYLLRGLFLDLCRKYQVPYQPHTFLELFAGLLKLHSRQKDDLCYTPPRGISNNS